MSGRAPKPRTPEVFPQAGLPAPQMKIETILGTDPEFVDAHVRILQSLVPRAIEKGLSLERLGDLATLRDRLQKEVSDNNHPIPPWHRMSALGAGSQTLLARSLADRKTPALDELAGDRRIEHVGTI